MTSARQSGDRHVLLFFRRSADRLWKYTLLLGLVFGAVWFFPLLRETSLMGISSKTLLLVATVITLFIAVFSFFSRNMSYVQAKSDCLRLVTPFLRLNISYRRMRTAYPVLLQQLFPMDTASWAQRQYLEPFYGKTVIVIEIKGYPLPLPLLKLFLPAQMFSPRTEGLVLAVTDWMKFSTELDTIHGNWMQEQKNKSRPPSGTLR